MCLIGLRLDNGPRPQLLIAANRDEFHDRPATAARWWPDHDLLAGRDETAGGTWLGISASGRFATVTNVREMRRTTGDRSRGEIPVDFLRSTQSSASYCHDLLARGHAFGGFNLLAWDGQQLWWCSNRVPAPARVLPGVHALSNHMLDTPWPKVRQMMTSMAALPTRFDAGSLIALLADRTRPAGRLPDTGVGRATELLLAPVFIRGERYGTRCSTALLIERQRFRLVEATYNRSGEEVGRCQHEGPFLDGQAGRLDQRPDPR